MLEEYLNRKDFSVRTHQGAGENETSNRFKTPSPGMGQRMDHIPSYCIQEISFCKT